MRLRSAFLVMTVLASSAVVAPPASAGCPADASFVTRDGTQLKLGEKQFRFAGTNLYWLGLDENVGGIAYPTYFRIRDTLDTAKATGMTVVRSHMTASTGHPLTLLPSSSAGFNDEAFRTIDYAIAYAGKIGIKLILPLTDNWAYYHGGHADFTKPYGLPDSAFYTDPRVIADFQAYVRHVMHHRNQLTGKRLVDDPTIMAWELGNELEGMTPEWIDTNAAQFSAWAPKQLMAAGRRFDIDPDTLIAPDIDIVDVHYYPPTAAKVKTDAATVTGAGKVYIAGEYASTAAGAELLDPLVADRNVTGMLSWSLFGHHDRYGFVPHDDGFTFHYPGDDTRMAAAVQAQITYAEDLGAAVSRKPVGTPLITAIGKRGGLNVVQWRGAANADGYRVQRARSERGPWRTAHTGLLTDNNTPWTDLTAPGDTWYRVVPFRGSSAGPISEPVYAGSRETVFTDPLETLDLASGNSRVRLEPAAGGTVARALGDAWISWSQPGIRRASFQVSASHSPSAKVQTSADGTSWRTVRSDADRLSHGRYSVNASVTGAAHVRLVWSGETTVQQATLWAADPAPVDRAPAAFTPAAPSAGARDVIGPDAFTWNPAAGAGYYSLTVSRNADLSSPVINVTGLSSPSFEPVRGLDPATVWHWRVRATNAAGSTNSPVASFTTRALPSTPVTLDDFEDYPDDAALTSAYVRNTGGDPIAGTLVTSPSGSGRAMALDVSAGPSGYAGISRTFPSPVDLWGQQGIELWLDRSGSPHEISIQFVADGVYWETTVPAGTTSGVVRVPFTAFKQPSWAPTGTLDLQKVTQLSIYLGGGDAGRLIVDDLRAYPGA